VRIKGGKGKEKEEERRSERGGLTNVAKGRKET
jgi:hypothetical protein